jgi:hypothetical protein
VSRPGPEAKWRGEEAEEADCALRTCNASRWPTTHEGEPTARELATADDDEDGTGASARDRQSEE